MLAFVLFGFSVPTLFAQENDTDMVDVNLITHFDDENEIPTSMSHAYGSRVALDGMLAENEDYDFAYWIVNGVINKNLPVDHEFVIRSKMDITAIFKPVDQHVVTFMDTNGDLLDIQYANDGESVTYEGLEYPTKPKLMVAEDPWGGANLDNITEDKILVLNYVRDTEETFTVEWKESMFGFQTTEYNYNDIVTLKADENFIDNFAYWKLNGEIVSYNPEFSFSVLDDVHVEPFFSEDSIDPEPRIVVSDNLELRTGFTSHLAQFYLPEGYELIEYGLVSTPHAFDDITFDTEGVDRFQGDKFFGPTNEFLMSLDEEDVTNPRAYLVYRDTLGQLGTVYSESSYGVVAEREIEERDLDDMYTMWIINPLGGYFKDWTAYEDDNALTGLEVRSDGSIYGPEDVIEAINYVEIDGVIYPISDFEDTVVVGDGS